MRIIIDNTTLIGSIIIKKYEIHMPSTQVEKIQQFQ